MHENLTCSIQKVTSQESTLQAGEPLRFHPMHMITLILDGTLAMQWPKHAEHHLFKVLIDHSPHERFPAHDWKLLQDKARCGASKVEGDTFPDSF